MERKVKRKIERMISNIDIKGPLTLTDRWGVRKSRSIIIQ